MKNSEDFRKSVFEKAKQYEIKRNTRRKKIVNTVSICSLCFMIGLSSYFAASKWKDIDLDSPESVSTQDNANKTESGTETTPLRPTETENTITTTMTPEGTATTTTPVWTSTTAASYSQTTTTETTIPTSTTSGSDMETPTTAETSVIPSPESLSPLYPMQIYLNHGHDIGYVHIESAEQLTFWLSRNGDTSWFFQLSQEDAHLMYQHFGEEFFEEYSLVLINVGTNRVSYQCGIGDSLYFYDMEIDNSQPIGYELHAYAVPIGTDVENYLFCYGR